MKIDGFNERKAISPVLATVILIAITLIAAVAIAGFVFGLFGSFSSTAHVAASPVTRTVAAPPICTVNLVNSGTSNVATLTTGATITYGGVKYTGSCTQTTVTAGSSAQATCSAWGPTPTLPVAGQAFVGSVALGNGATVLFSGAF